MDTDDLVVELVETLDRDLELLAALRYRMVVLGALAGADQSEFITLAVQEVERAYEALRLADLVRAATTEQLAEELDLKSMPRIDQIAALTHPGWTDVLLERRKELLEVISAIQSLSHTISEALGRRVALAEEALAFLRTEKSGTYGAYGRPAPRWGVLVEGAI